MSFLTENIPLWIKSKLLGLWDPTSLPKLLPDAYLPPLCPALHPAPGTYCSSEHQALFPLKTFSLNVLSPWHVPFSDIHVLTLLFLSGLFSEKSSLTFYLNYDPHPITISLNSSYCISASLFIDCLPSKNLNSMMARNLLVWFTLNLLLYPSIYNNAWHIGGAQ